MLHSVMKWSCFIWKGGLMKRISRCMKHGFAVWSGTLCREAKLFPIYSTSLYKRLQPLVLHSGAKRRCFIAKWNEAASSSFAIGYGGTSLKRRFYEAHLSVHEARLRRMKRHFVPWGEAFSGFMFFVLKLKKLKTEVLSFIQDKKNGGGRTNLTYDISTLKQVKLFQVWWWFYFREIFLPILDQAENFGRLFVFLKSAPLKFTIL